MTLGRWAANHDQRKGQWLINHIRNDAVNCKSREELCRIIEYTLWNMDNKKFDEIMGNYYD